MSILNLADLFVFGLGCDIAGAYLVARGLLASNEEILNSSGTFLGFNPRLVVARARDKVAAQFGIGSLLTGFLLQGVAYVLTVADGTEPSPGDSGAAAFATVVGISAIVAVLGVYAAARRRLERRLLIDIASHDRNGRTPRPQAETLRLLGSYWSDVEAADGEDHVSYARRAFGVEAEWDPE